MGIQMRCSEWPTCTRKTCEHIEFHEVCVDCQVYNELSNKDSIRPPECPDCKETGK